MFRRKPPVLDSALRQRVAANLWGGTTLFTGRLAEYDDKTYVLEACETVPAPGETPRPIQGRQYLDRPYVFLTELPCS